MSYVRDLRVEFGLDAPPTREPEMINAVEMLEANSVRLADLSAMQHTRLCQPPPMTLTDASGPSALETQLGNRTAVELGKLVGEAQPGQMVSTTGLHAAMGVADPDVDLDLFSEFFK
jgi:hypothetical protein